MPIAEADGVASFVAIESAAGLLSLVQMGVLEFHVWGSHIETVEYPDQIVFDFDPDPALPVRARDRGRAPDARPA